MRYRDVFPPGNEQGEQHATGSDCPCIPWAFYDEQSNVVVAHRHFTESMIFVGSGCPADQYESADGEVEWVEVEVAE